MKIDKIAAFSFENSGGNPAGVLFCSDALSDEMMLSIAKEVNYSETAFIQKEDDALRIRYFSPETEIAFCGHATIASGMVLGEKFGLGDYRLRLNEGEITLSIKDIDGKLYSSFMSIPTHTKDIEFDVAKDILDIFNIDVSELDERFPIKIGFSGNNHPIIFLNSKEKLENMEYDFQRAKELMEKENLTTISLLFCENESLYHSRNAFAFGGVYEDPATGSAAVALAEYLRNIGFKHEGRIEILQGFDMRVPCRLIATFSKEKGSPILVSGESRYIV